MLNKIQQLYKNSLFQNSMYPMLATGVMAGFGFFFWLFSARLFTDAEVGLAATLISIMNMIAALSLIGFDTATIRFLSHTEKKNESISTGFSVIAIAACILSSAFILLLDHISPHLTFIADNLLTTALFIGFSIFSALNIYTDSIFLAYRKTKYTFVIDTIFSVIKVGLPFLFVSYGTVGIFAAAAVAQTVGFLLSLVALVRAFNYTPRLLLNKEVLARTWSYSAGNYIADVLNFLPLAVLPIIITNRLGPELSAYFYIVMMIANLLYVIPASTMRSLFAEGSYDEAGITIHTRGAIRTTAYIMLPAMFVLFLFGDFALHLFGADYSTEGIAFLHTMTLTGFVVAVFALYGSLFRLTHNILSLITRNAVFATTTITLVYVWLPYGLLGVGAAYASGNILASVVSHLLYRFHTWYMTRPHHADKTPKPFTLEGLPNRVYTFVDEFVIWPIRSWCDAWRQYLYCRLSGNYRTHTLLCYPDTPTWYHVLYRTAPRLCWKISNNPKKPADIIIYFEDTTTRARNTTLDTLATHTKVLNKDCLDISKQKVEEVFVSVFGYGMALDPETHTGKCVRKSNTNAVHDGVLIDCPTTPEPGYIYQEFITTLCGEGQVTDLRIPIVGNTIPFVLRRYKCIRDMFDKTIAIDYLHTEEALSIEECAKISTFARAMGLDYGEIDALRSTANNKLYIVDVNSHPAGPVEPLFRNKELLARWYQELCTAMEKEFLPKQTKGEDTK